MGARHLVYSGSAGDGHRHGDQLVHSAALPAVARNDYRADLSGNIALGDVAGNWFDGCGRIDVAGPEMEFDRQDLSRSEVEYDRAE